MPPAPLIHVPPITVGTTSDCEGFLPPRSWATVNGGRPFADRPRGVQLPEADGLDHRSVVGNMWRDEMSELLLAVLTEALGAALLALLLAAARRVMVRRPA
jgi:hypothetical protein